jgi:hypothetical protein
MIAFFVWCILFVLCWPVAILGLVLYPFVWLLLLPFRIAGIAVHGALALMWAIVMLPFRLLSAPLDGAALPVLHSRIPLNLSSRAEQNDSQ